MQISLPGALFLIFLTLKLVDKIDWSWLWVTSPLWIPFAIMGIVFMGAVAAAAVAHVCKLIAK
jgi:hypothetical protein